jgi:hypothetical protein
MEAITIAPCLTHPGDRHLRSSIHFLECVPQKLDERLHARRMPVRLKGP